MEESNKENKISPIVYAKLMQNQAELTAYLKYIRHRPQPNRIVLTLPKNLTTQTKQPPRQKKASIQAKVYVEEYLRLVRQATNLQNYSGRKIITKLIQYLEEFPTMSFLVQTINSFGKERKKLCLSETSIMAEVNDQMIPLFQKILQRVQFLKKQAQSKKLMELGQRIAHLQKMVQVTPKQQHFVTESPLRMLEPQRVQKYLIMQENIARAQKNYGKFSQTFHKNQQIFSNINRVYQQISKSKQLNR